MSLSFRRVAFSTRRGAGSRSIGSSGWNFSAPSPAANSNVNRIIRFVMASSEHVVELKPHLKALVAESGIDPQEHRIPDVEPHSDAVASLQIVKVPVSAPV